VALTVRGPVVGTMATMSDSAPDQPAKPAQVSVEDFLAQMKAGERLQASTRPTPLPR